MVLFVFVFVSESASRVEMRWKDTRTIPRVQLLVRVL
jgi:hypothetical protein